MNDMTPAAAAAAATPKTCSNSNWSTAGTSSSSSSSNIKRNSNNIGTQWTASRNSFFFQHFFFVWSTLVFVALRQSSLLNSKWEIAAAGAIFMVDLILCCRCWLCGIFCGRAHHVWPFVCITNLAETDWLTDWLPACLCFLAKKWVCNWVRTLVSACDNLSLNNFRVPGKSWCCLCVAAAVFGGENSINNNVIICWVGRVANSILLARIPGRKYFNASAGQQKEQNLHISPEANWR